MREFEEDKKDGFPVGMKRKMHWTFPPTPAAVPFVPPVPIASPPVGGDYVSDASPDPKEEKE